MTRTNHPILWHEVGIYVSAHGIVSQEADYDQPITPSDVQDVFVNRSICSPLALVMPVTSLFFGVAILWIIVEPPRLPWWGFSFPMLCIGYAVYAIRQFSVNRQYKIFISAPKLTSKPIRFYVTDSADEAAELVRIIKAVIDTRGCPFA